MSEPEHPPAPGAANTETWSTDPAFAAPRDLTGATLGDFHVERKLGRGGMGEVYLATQISLNRPVALKVLRPDLLANPTYLSRFEAEAWAAAKLNHPNIVHIYTLGCLDGVRFIAMEYVQGTNLREYIERKGPPELPLALQIMRQSGQAVGAAGEVGLVHRDIKPENLLLTRKGQVKVADFGLCRDKEGQDLHLTQTGVTMGTPMYMSPEQVQGHSLDHRSDLYSLGVTFYHMLAGQPPFRAETALALALKHVKDIPVNLAVHRPDLPPELVSLVMKLMSKAAADRYASAAEMLRDLARIKEALHAASVSLSIPEAPAIDARAATALKTETDNGTPARRPGRPLRERLSGIQIGGKAIAAVVLLAGTAGAAAGWMSRADDLLGPGAPNPRQAPAIWMAPWKAIPRQASAAEQYHYAQIQVSEADLEAAWLAVPGNFPNDPTFTPEAYTQLARWLFRHHDAQRLTVLAGELERANRQHEEKLLIPVARAAAAALENDVNRVLELLDGPSPNYTKIPGVAELALEVVLYAARSPAGKDHPRLKTLASDYLKALRADFLELAELTSPS